MSKLICVVALAIWISGSASSAEIKLTSRANYFPNTESLESENNWPKGDHLLFGAPERTRTSYPQIRNAVLLRVVPSI